MLTLYISVVLLMIVVNGFFAMAEIALVASRNARLRPLAEAGNPGAQAALELKADPSRLLSTVQIGVTVIALRPATQLVKNNPFPRWWGYTSLWITIMFEAGAIAFVPRSGPFAWNGLLVFGLSISFIL